MYLDGLTGLDVFWTVLLSIYFNDLIIDHNNRKCIFIFLILIFF